MDGNGKDLSKQFEAAGKRPSAIEFDLMAYVEHLAELDGTLEEKLQVLGELAKIAIGIVDMGFEVHFPQENCGKSERHACADSAQDSADALDSEP